MIHDVLHHHRHGEKIVGGNVEEALDLAGMQIDRQHAVGAGFGDQIGHQLGGDRRARADFAVLAGIAEIGNHGGDAPGRRAAQRIDHDQQFHQIVVGGKAGRLDHEHVLAADIFLHLDEHFHVGEAAHLSLDRLQREILADGIGQGVVGIACDKAHAPRTVQIRHRAESPRQLEMKIW